LIEDQRRQELLRQHEEDALIRQEEVELAKKEL
jgi:hypothetical protein